jgi:DNA-binding transcriptional LysR family regulator
MERRLGVQLFTRNRRSTTLTYVGETLLRDARRILEEIDCARRNLVSAASGRSGRLCIALCDGVAHPKVARLLARSHVEDPDVDFQLIHSAFAEQLRGLRCGVVDVGFGPSACHDKDLC